MGKVKTGLFATLGRVVWHGAAKIGIPYAKRKISGGSGRNSQKH
ncbi:hypothetical protein [Nakamurella flava]|nr:hypothetical protein [Nakamurella flava]